MSKEKKMKFHNKCICYNHNNHHIFNKIHNKYRFNKNKSNNYNSNNRSSRNLILKNNTIKDKKILNKATTFHHNYTQYYEVVINFKVLHQAVQLISIQAIKRKNRKKKL